MRSHTSCFGLSAALLSATLIGACSTRPAQDPKDQISRELKSADINNVNVDYDRDAKVVHLKGAVDSTMTKSRAEMVAQQAVGTSGTVANELTVVGMNDRTADDMDGAIRRALNATVKNDQALAERDINFDVNNGVVTIKGDVQSAAEKTKVGEMARRTENVKDVVNSLDIKTAKGQKPAKPASPARR